jgi:hypothetical protein
MDKTKISAVLDEFGTLLELTGTNPFKIRAFENAARSILNVEADLTQLARDKKLREAGSNAQRHERGSARFHRGQSAAPKNTTSPSAAAPRRNLELRSARPLPNTML